MTLVTSPLYTLNNAFASLQTYADGELTEPDLFGMASLVVWALTLVPSIKYCGFVLRATKDGEGGTFVLLSLLQQDSVFRRLPHYARVSLMPLALSGVALLIASAILTPAI